MNFKPFPYRIEQDHTVLKRTGEVHLDILNVKRYTTVWYTKNAWLRYGSVRRGTIRYDTVRF